MTTCFLCGSVQYPPTLLAPHEVCEDCKQSTDVGFLAERHNDLETLLIVTKGRLKTVAALLARVVGPKNTIEVNGLKVESRRTSNLDFTALRQGAPDVVAEYSTEIDLISVRAIQ